MYVYTYMYIYTYTYVSFSFVSVKGMAYGLFLVVHALPSEARRARNDATRLVTANAT